MAISDDFSGDLSKWTEFYGTWQITVGDEAESTEEDLYASMLYTDESTGVDDHWAKTKISFSVTVYPGLVLRGDPGATYAYTIYVRTPSVFWRRIKNDGTGVSIDSTGLTFNTGDVLAAQVAGTGDDTVITVWVNPSGADPSEWGAADATFTTNPGVNAVDTGQYVGLQTYNIDPQDAQFDDFAGKSEEAPPPTYIPKVIMIT